MGTDNSDTITADEASTARQGQSMLKVPSRSSSQQKIQSAPSATGRSSSSGRSKESKNSYTDVQGNGSLNAARHAGDNDLPSTPGNTQPSSPSASEQKQRRKKGGLLSLLGCCGVPDDEDKNNVHKLNKLPQRPTTAKSRSQTSQDQYARHSNEKPNSTAPAVDHQGAASGSQDVIMEETDTHQKNPPAVAVEPPSAPQSAGGGNSSNGDDSDMPDAPEEPRDEPDVETSEEQDDRGVPPPPGPNSATAVAFPPVTAIEEQRKWLLPPIAPEHKGRKCLVLDLDETLVHSSFKILHQADFTIPVEIEGNYHNVYVIKRPGVDEFMKRVGELYEVVVFTASVSKYGDPLLDQLDIHNVIHHRLFRESCYNHQGNYVKDLSQVGRDLKDTIIIDNSPTSYIFHPQHAVPISSWFSDAHDNELLDLIPVLEDLAGPKVSDVSLVLDVTL
ncbi:hypothetical protein PWT90_07684 [Aphanocladium album]|nr:hypothetical protein PWT90_07684 [Aphanocladium album]